MFDCKTTIILGAGASWGYGYPLGDDLIAQMISAGSTKKKPDQLNEDESIGLRLNELLQFYDPISIDAFLRHYKNDTDLIAKTKKVISTIIVSSGNDTYFRRGARFGGSKRELSNWYRFLWDAIVSNRSVEDLVDPDEYFNFDIITFNYDTSLEYFLYSRVTALGTMFSEEQQQKMLDKLSSRINHVYGSIFQYKWMGGNENNYTLNYSSSNPGFPLASKVNQIYNNIILIDDRNERDYKQLQTIISDSSQVIFLGFGFDDINIGPSVLNLKETLNPKRGNPSPNDRWLPVIKYTNLNDSEIINSKVESVIERPPTVKRSGTGIKVGEANREIYKSIKKVYQALDQDFTLNTI